MAGTTCPAVPPAATTTLGPSGTAGTAPFTRGRAPAFDDAQFAGRRRTGSSTAAVVRTALAVPPRATFRISPTANRHDSSAEFP